ncbi:MAG: exosortase-associated EpsI family protein [Planctomycetota bacterium]|nr:exosortase-associated EpsI family protein [Planctomycetota bacterium]
MIRFQGSTRGVYFAVLGVLVIGAAVFRGGVYWLDIHLQKEAVLLRGPLSNIPASIGKWRKLGDDASLSEAMIEELGTPQYLSRYYARDGDASKGVAEVHLAYYTGLIDTVPHVPERCWGASGLVMTTLAHTIDIPLDASDWKPAEGIANHATGMGYPTAWTTDPVTKRRQRVLMPVPEEGWEMTVTAFKNSSNPKELLFGGYFFIANGRLTSSAYRVRNLAFELSERFAYYCKVQINARVPDGPNAEQQFAELSASILQSLLPELMLYLPDWSEVEARSDESVKSPSIPTHE